MSVRAVVTTVVLGAALMPSGALAQLAGPRLNSMIAAPEGTAALSVSTSPPSDIAPTLTLDGGRMEAAGYASAADGLGLLPGIFVRRTNEFGRADPDIRGFGDNGTRISVMVDGRPEKMPFFGCVVTHSLTLNNVERVEVVEGPASALFGSGAIGGAVNIVTRGAQSPFEGDVTASYGSHNTRLLRVRGGASSGNNDFFAAGERRASDGFTNNSSYDAGDYTIEYGRKVNDNWRLRLRNTLYSGTEYDPAPVDLAPSATSWFDYRRGAADLSAGYKNDGWTGAAKLYNTYGRHSFSNGWLSDDNTYGALVKGGWAGDSGARADAGAEYSWMGAERYAFSTTPNQAYNRYEYAAYAAAQSPLGTMLLANGALRLTGDNNNAAIGVPSAGLAVKPWNEVETYAVVSKGIRFPQMSELYAFPVSNPNLKPETAWGYEAGVKYRPAERLHLRASAYMTEGHDLIQVQSGLYRNVGDYLFRGFQGEAKYDLTGGLALSANYTFLDPGIRTTGRPANTAVAGLVFEDGGTGLMANCQYAGGYYGGDNRAVPLNDIFTVNLSGWRNLSEGFRLFAGINNLFDRRYVIYATNTAFTGQFLQPGLTINAGVKVLFGGRNG
ncbi:MAG: TonB-dependent receptor [Elusimicrobiales bacterium]